MNRNNTKAQSESITWETVANVLEASALKQHATVSAMLESALRLALDPGAFALLKQYRDELDAKHGFVGVTFREALNSLDECVPLLKRAQRNLKAGGAA